MMKYGITVISGKDGPTAVAYTRGTGYAARMLLCTVFVILSLLFLKSKKK